MTRFTVKKICSPNKFLIKFQKVVLVIWIIGKVQPVEEKVLEVKEETKTE